MNMTALEHRHHDGGRSKIVDNGAQGSGSGTKPFRVAPPKRRQQVEVHEVGCFDTRLPPCSPRFRRASFGQSWCFVRREIEKACDPAQAAVSCANATGCDDTVVLVRRHDEKAVRRVPGDPSFGGADANHRPAGDQE